MYLYFKQAWHLMKQNRFFSAVYIIGTGLAISMVMVLAVVYHIRTANIAPEVHRDRMCYLDFVIYKYSERDGSYSSSLGIRYVKDVVLTLKKPEAIAITTSPIYQYFQGGEMFASVAGNDNETKIIYMGCNADFWKVYEFHFIYGKPFAESDFESGLRTIVLCRSMARNLFGREDVVGQTVMLNEVEYRVCGVVEDVSATLEHTYSQAWMPYTSMSNVIAESVDEKMNTVGKLQANILLRDNNDITAVQAELEEAVKKYNTTLVGGKVMANGGSPDELASLIEKPGLIISSNLAEDFFNRTNVLGEELVSDKDTMKIIALTEPVRSDEYNDNMPYAWFARMDALTQGDIPESTCMNIQITFRIRPNVNKAGFEKRFMKEMRQQLRAGNFWVSSIQSYNDMLIASLPALFICGNLVYADIVSASSAESPLLRFVEVSVITWLVLAVIIILGVWYPAYRASKVAPSDALRAE